MLNFVKIISLLSFVLIFPGLVFVAPFIGATGALYLIGFEYLDHTTIMIGAFIFGLLSFHLYFYLFLAGSFSLFRSFTTVIFQFGFRPQS